ncbi:hypothetical protein D6745_01415 [Candidatus Woesearchaeota archaeon]|nr:MAG: hypothetical protein D6745_01415 [Candidatus Woesearchaeota archaeon]
MERISNNRIALIAIIIMFISLLTNWMIIYTTKQQIPVGAVTKGKVSICINEPPELSVPCNNKGYVGCRYYCDADATDQFSTEFYFNDDTDLFDINETTGIIDFTPVENESGNYSINISVSEPANCSNNESSQILNLSISANVCGDGICVAQCGENRRTCSADCGSSSNQAAGSGGGGGGGGGAIPSPDQLDALPSFDFDPELLKVFLNIGEVQERQVVISNTGTKDININIELEQLQKYVSLSENEFFLPVAASKTISIKFDAKNTQPGVYTGNLVFTSGIVKKKLPIIIEIESVGIKLDLRVSIPEEFQMIEKGEDIAAKIALFNMGDKKEITVSLKYGVKDMNDMVIVSEQEDVQLTTSLELLKRLDLPYDINKGNYVYFAEAIYKDKKSVNGKIFEVVEETIREEVPSPVREDLNSDKLLSDIEQRFSKQMLLFLLILILIIINVSYFTYRKLTSIEKEHAKHAGEKEKEKIKDERKEAKKDKIIRILSKASETKGKRKERQAISKIKIKRKVKEKEEALLEKKKLERKAETLKKSFKLRYISKQSYEKGIKEINEEIRKLNRKLRQ